MHLTAITRPSATHTHPPRSLPNHTSTQMSHAKLPKSLPLFLVQEDAALCEQLDPTLRKDNAILHEEQLGQRNHIPDAIKANIKAQFVKLQDRAGCTAVAIAELNYELLSSFSSLPVVARCSAVIRLEHKVIREGLEDVSRMLCRI